MKKNSRAYRKTAASKENGFRILLAYLGNASIFREAHTHGANMKISTRGRYALRFMIDLAQHDNGEYIALKDISQRQEISVKYLEQITALLSKFGLLTSVRGPQGGYKLSKKPADYKIGEILHITEGSLAPVACLDSPENFCPKKDICQTLPMWKKLNDTIANFMSGITLEDLVTGKLNEL